MEKVRRVLRETGPLGLVRRTARVSLVGLRDGADRLANELLLTEAERRVPADERALAHRNRALRGVHAGRPCFLLGTGPSLASLDLAPLADAVTFGVNGFYRHPAVAQWKPTYFGLMDWSIFDASLGFEPFIRDVRRHLIGTKFFVPSMFHRAIREHDWLPEDETFYVPVDGSMADAAPAAIDLERLLPATPNALQFALAIALYMGCSPVYLLGADHDWLARRASREEVADPHFYDGQIYDMQKVVPAQFDKHESYYEMITYCEMLWRGYRTLDAVARRGGQRIINVSPGSYLDVFPFADYADVVARGVR